MVKKWETDTTERINNMEEKLSILKTDERLYKVVELMSKLAKKNNNYYRLYKKNNSLFFYDFNVGILYEAENTILENTIIPCKDGEYKIFKGIKNEYLLVKQSDHIGNLNSYILDKTINANSLCYINKNDNYMIHNIMESALISDNDLVLITSFDNSTLKLSNDGNNFLIESYYEQQYPNLKTTTYIVLNLEWTPDE